MNQYKIVDFQHYCPLCEHNEISGYEEPCNECLNNPANIDSHKPVKFEEKEK